ncbi:MAG TPA: single-stranded DNA-binding protein [bacterium]|nr:single-stranded DNA-binding protein [bacterium]HPP11513.1 single-stranded DNA-binding protein [bacterium]
MSNPSLNKVFLVGRLTRDPELRYTPSGQAVTTFGLAVNREYTTREGKKEDDTCFVNIVSWGRQAELCSEYLRRGHLVLIEGRLKYRTWETAEKEKRASLEVYLENIQFLERPTGEAGSDREEIKDDETES